MRVEGPHGVEPQSACAWDNADEAGSADSAASMYFWTLSVENCGAIGMPITRSTPLAARSVSASLMNGRQFRIPTRTGTSPPSRAPSAAAWACVMSVSGERPPIAL